MALVSPTQVTDGTSIDASDVNTPINQLATEINGNLDANNLATNAVSTAKIQDAAVTNAKLSTTAGEIGAAWQSWTPTLSGSMTDGDWTKTNSKYIKIGKMVFFKLHLTAADATPMGGGAGDSTFTLPVTSIASYSPIVSVIGTGVLIDSTTYHVGHASWMSTTTANIYNTLASGTYTILNNTDNDEPFAWSTGDEIFIQGFYEAA